MRGCQIQPWDHLILRLISCPLDAEAPPKLDARHVVRSAIRPYHVTILKRRSCATKPCFGSEVAEVFAEPEAWLPWTYQASLGLDVSPSIPP
jgi:hypothetical protein